MSIISKSIALASAVSFLAIAGTASAEDSFDARFQFSPDAHPSVTYTSFVETAADLCRVDRIQAGGVAMKAKIEMSCTEALVADAVEATQLDELIAFHNQQTNPGEPRTQFAQRD